MNAKSISAEISDFVCSLRFEDISATILNSIKSHLLDSLGVAYAGSKHKAATICYKTMAAFIGMKEATVLGKAQNLPSTAAAFIMGKSGFLKLFGKEFD